MVYVVTVGLSLKSNYCREVFGDPRCSKRLEDMYEDMKRWLMKKKRSEASKTCAELNIILTVERKLKDKKIYLLHTESSDESLFESSYWTAKLIQDYLESKYKASVYLENIGEPSKPSMSINKMWKKLIEILRRSNGNMRIISAGGLKWMSGYAVTFGIINNIDVYYAFENQENIVLPSFPISWDLSRLFIFKIINDKRSSKFIEFEDIEELKKLVPYREPLVSRVNSEKIKRWFERSIPIWSNLWIGDLIPETVEHSKNHSRRILDRLELMFEYNFKIPKWINDEFFTIMITSAYLHDIGHTVMEFEGWNLRDYPNAVREIHNITSVYEMVKERELLNLEETLTDDEFKAILLVSLYHRKFMKLNRNFNLNNRKFVRTALEKLKKYLKDNNVLDLEIGESFTKSLERNVKDEKVKRAAIGASALLKFLDELDVQADRIVDEYYMRVRFKRIIDEVKYLLKDLNVGHEFANYKNKLIDIVGNLERERKKRKKWESHGFNLLDEKFHNFKNKVYEKSYEDILENILRINPTLVKAYFKLEQFDHFAKHANVLAAYPDPEKLMEKKSVIGAEIIFRRSIPQDIKESVINDFKEVLQELKNFREFHRVFRSSRFSVWIDEEKSI